MPGRVFLSFAREDQAVAWLLTREFERRKISYYNYLIHRSVEGPPPVERITEKVRHSAELLMILSPEARRAPLLGFELGLATAFGLPRCVALHYLTLDEARADRKWFELVKDNAFEMANIADLETYLDGLEIRLHG